MRLTSMFAASAVLALSAGAALACPDENMTAVTTIQLDGGFMPDPAVLDVETGAGIDLNECDDSMLGAVSDQPTVDVFYGGGADYLSFAFEADLDFDPVMVIYGPEGVIFNDDADDLNPVITIEDPAEGVYVVWIGSVEGEDGLPGTLYISEMPQ